jgi:hypothetical protein
MSVHVEPRVSIAQVVLPAHDVLHRTSAFRSALDGYRRAMAEQLHESGRRRVPGLETLAVTYVRLGQVSVGPDGRVDAVYVGCPRSEASSAMVTVKWPLMPESSTT